MAGSKGWAFRAARLTANWFSPRELATKFSIWNSSHNIGSILIVLLCGALVTLNWRLCFLVPARLALASAGVLFWMLPDTPESVGLPEVEGTSKNTQDLESTTQFRAFLFRQVFRNPYIWILSVANFFVYSIRYAVFDWGRTF
jgi:OPA family glycerol-3-phosphate transporter-like MFS transporter/OPA family sugar phosphate sensor protein UhpC-like MFS transporter